MVSGTRTSRPKWPEYQVRGVTHRNLYMIDGKDIVDENGEATRVSTFNDFANFVFDHNALMFVQDIRGLSFAADCIDRPKDARLMCSDVGQVHLGRLNYKQSKRWIVQSKSWDGDCTSDFLKGMREWYEYVGVGVAITPASHGSLLMKVIHDELGLGVHSGLSLACENFLRAHAPGGIILTPGIGNEYAEAISLDATSAYVANYTVHPAGGGVRFINGHCNHFATYFARCLVTIHSELALSPFSTKGNFKSKVTYPTMKGQYEAYLWKEQVETTRAAGCTVQVMNGYGWKELTNDNQWWAQEVYSLRRNAKTEFNEDKAKRFANSAIGHHAMGRERHYLVRMEDAPEGTRHALDATGWPLPYCIMDDRDDTSAYMVHWNKYTIMMCNEVVYHKSLPYAQQGRLIAIYVDGIVVVEVDERHTHVERKLIKEYDIKPGTWLWELLHEVRCQKNGWLESKEKNRRIGYTEAVL